MITTNIDLYSAVLELSRVPKDTSEVELASELEGTLRISSLPGEILGEVRIQLLRVQDTPMRRVEVRAKVDEVLRSIGYVIGPPA